MAYRCSVKRYGTLLYCYGGNLAHALSVSLGQMRNKPHNQGRGETEHSEFQMNLKQTCEVLNDKIHKCINKLVQQDSASPHSIEDINIDKFISEMDQDIWTAVCTLTKPLSTRPKKWDNRSTIRKIRRYFCVCILLFTTNRRCSFPLHTFLTDAIETCGGSSRLVRLLNRLGVCASADTHSRYVLYRVHATINDGPLSGYPMHALTLVSLDSLDYIHSFARMFCGLQQSSWHGTTVQFVQPQPLSLHVVHSTTCNRQISYLMRVTYLLHSTLMLCQLLEHHIQKLHTGWIPVQQANVLTPHLHQWTVQVNVHHFLTNKGEWEQVWKA